MTHVARREISEAALTYEALRVGLAKKILLELSDTVSQISLFPGSFPLLSNEIRRAQVSVIPYQLFFAVNDEFVTLLGFIPARIDPNRKLQIIGNRTLFNIP
ncbi:MAG: hypothetical protein U0930_23420 [Pirellulales bacterium]